MKQKTIRTDKATVLVVELPEGAINPVVSMGYITARVPNHSYGIPTHDIWDYKKNEEYMAKYDPSKEYDDWAKNLHVEGNWQLLGRLPEVTEEQWKQVVEEWRMPFPDGRCDVFYKDYVEDVFTEDLPSESALTLLQANEVYFENRNPWEKDVLQRNIDNMLDKESQSKVWDKERCFLFLKIK